MNLANHKSIGAFPACTSSVTHFRDAVQETWLKTYINNVAVIEDSN